MDIIDWLMLLIVAVPIPFALYGAWREYLNDRKIIDLIGFSLVLLFPIVSLIGMIAVLSDRGRIGGDDFTGQKATLNAIRKCYNCGITSRNYQLKERDWYGKIKCSHCGSNHLSNSESDNGETFPFAPKLSEFKTIKYILHKNKVKKINTKLEQTERYDKALEVYGQLQMKKLQELETKANEIRKELAKSGGQVNDKFL